MLRVLGFFFFLRLVVCFQDSIRVFQGLMGSDLITQGFPYAGFPLKEQVGSLGYIGLL